LQCTFSFHGSEIRKFRKNSGANDTVQLAQFDERQHGRDGVIERVVRLAPGQFEVGPACPRRPYPSR
jgi:hypothetical protein